MHAIIIFLFGLVYLDLTICWGRNVILIVDRVRSAISPRVDPLRVMRRVPKMDQAIGPRDLLDRILLNQTHTEFDLEEPNWDLETRN